MPSADYNHRRAVDRASAELDAISRRRSTFVAENAPPYSAEQEAELAEINTLALAALDQYYQIKHQK